jgi:pyruvate/2-oxoglutarate dehydrogenase complex dihydrolipoamide dehydrogenase (E3) component
MTQHFDAIVVGAGQSGPSLAVRLAEAGRKVALIERRGLGGTCVNDGCIPTKTLIASARAAWMARRAAEYGIEIEGSIRVDWAKVMARKDAVVQASRDGLTQWIGGTANLELIEGHARFVPGETQAHRMQVGDRTLEAEQIFLNVGARALVPEVAGLKDGPYLTNSSMMDLSRVPAHLVILGGSYIGLEFAQMMRRFGSQVTVIERGERLIAREDEDVSAEIRRFLELEGIGFVMNAELTSVERAQGRSTCRTSQGDIEGSDLLVAVGRVPNTHDLGIEHPGLEVKRGYLQVNDELETNVPGIFAIGDCNGQGAFTHTSYNDYEIVAANVLDAPNGGTRRKVSDRLPIYGLFVDPPLGRVGMNEREARASGRKVLVGKRPMTRVGRARERGEMHGFIKVMVDADSKEILGAAILGVEGDEAIHAIADVMYAKAPYTTISNAVHAHPTVSELVPTTLQSLEPLA